MCSLIMLAVFALLGFGWFGITNTSEFAPLDPLVELEAAALPSGATATPELPTLLECKPLDPAVDRALVDGYHLNALGADVGWVYTPSARAGATLGTWLNETRGAVAYMELLHYDCGVPYSAVSDYFNESSFPIIFAGYDGYQLITSCGMGELQHFIFEVVFDGVDYEARYWFEPLEARRLAMFMLTTPVSESSYAVSLTRQLYPTLPDCQGAG
jgi:hypothetical protein